MNCPKSKAEAIERGVKKYYSGEPCKYGHLSFRRASNGECEECQRLRSKKGNRDREYSGKIIPLEGKRFGMLTAISFEGVQDNDPKCAMWKCQCDCGKTRVVDSQSLRKGHTWSCGCTNKIGGMLAPGQASRNALYASYRCQAKRRNRTFTIDRDLFCDLTKKNCFYCGKEPSLVKEYKSTNGPCVYNGLDRLNNDIGYEPDNVVPCCKDCNRAKSDLSGNEFLDWIYRIAEFQNWIK